MPNCPICSAPNAYVGLYEVECNNPQCVHYHPKVSSEETLNDCHSVFVITTDKSKEWYLNDKRHREDGPAVEYADGYKAWYLNDKRHREDGPAIEYANGSKTWYLNGKRHREDGPAIEYVHGTKCWYFNDKLHREDGPAVECTSGGKEWWLNGEQLTEEEFNERMSSCEGKIVELDGKKYKPIN